MDIVRHVESRENARRRWIRKHGARGPVPELLLDGSVLHEKAADARATATRADKRRWRRRLSRARHTKHARRAVIPFGLVPFGEGPAIGLYDREDDYPVITRAPWARRW